ncbi:MAG: hypothetical protein R2825_21200 [Saprospiraceae bacterium]
MMATLTPSGIADDFDTTITYSYNTLFGLGNLGPYKLNSWTVNGLTYTETFNNINDPPK